MFIKDSQLRGLYQRERAAGNVWVVKAKQRGLNKPVTITLGRVDVIPVNKARQLAKEKLSLLAQGINPNQENNKQLETTRALSITLEDALEEYLSLRELKHTTVKSYRQVISRSFHDWVNRPIRNITRNDILKRYKEIKDGISKRAAQPVKANPRGLADAQKAMRYLSAIMNSYSGDKLNGEALLPDGNPVLVLKDKRARKTLQPRERFLEKEERRALFHHLSIVGHPNYEGSLKTAQADYIAFLMVTGLRQTEARTLKWSDIDRDTYTIQDTKNNKPHTLPKTELVRKIFERNANDTPWVFPGRNGAASMYNVVKNASKESGVAFSAHDLRRTAATIASEHGFTQDQIGRLLNHSNTSVTDKYIQKTTVALRPILQLIEDEILANYEAQDETGVELEDVNLDEAL